MIINQLRFIYGLNLVFQEKFLFSSSIRLLKQISSRDSCMQKQKQL